MPEAGVVGGAGEGPTRPYAPAAVRRILCVVVTYNRRDVLLRCLERLLHRVVVPPGFRLELLVVDNDSADDTRDAVALRFPQVQVLNTGGNLGGSGAFRLGLRHAIEHGYDLAWLHDNDAFPSRHLLQHYVAALDELGGKAIVGGSMHQLEAPRRLNEVGGFFGRNRAVDIQLPLLGHRSTPTFRSGARPAEVDYVAFASALMPVSLVSRVGLPEDLFLHYDDVEFCLRARAAGYTVAAVPAAVFWHESWFAKPKTWMQYYDTRNSLWTVALRLPGKLRRRRAIWRLSAAKNIVSGRPALAAAILDGLRDQARGVKGRVAVPTAGFATHDIATGGVEPLLATSGCTFLALDCDSLQALPRPYRARWLAALAGLGDRAFVSRLAARRLTIHPLPDAGAFGSKGPVVLPAPYERAAARRIAADALLVRSASRTGPRARWALRGFRKLLWLNGTHVLDHGSGANRRDLARLLARWLWSWVYLGARRGGAA